MDSDKVTIRRQEHDISEVVDYFVRGYELPPGARVLHHDFNYDPHTGKVWLRLTVQGGGPDAAA